MNNRIPLLNVHLCRLVLGIAMSCLATVAVANHVGGGGGHAGTGGHAGGGWLSLIHI